MISSFLTVIFTAICIGNTQGDTTDSGCGTTKFRNINENFDYVWKLEGQPGQNWTEYILGNSAFTLMKEITLKSELLDDAWRFILHKVNPSPSLSKIIMAAVYMQNNTKASSQSLEFAITPEVTANNQKIVFNTAGPSPHNFLGYWNWATSQSLVPTFAQQNAMMFASVDVNQQQPPMMTTLAYIQHLYPHKVILWSDILPKLKESLANAADLTEITIKFQIKASVWIRSEEAADKC